MEMTVPSMTLNARQLPRITMTTKEKRESWARGAKTGAYPNTPIIAQPPKNRPSVERSFQAAICQLGVAGMAGVQGVGMDMRRSLLSLSDKSIDLPTSC